MFANCNRRTQPGVTERECDIVAALEVLVDQRLQRYVSQKVATVSKERFLSQLDFDVFDSAASVKQHRFVHKCERNFGAFILQLLVIAAIIVIFIFLARHSSPEISKLSPSILILLAVPIFIAGKRYLQTKCKIYELTTERLKITEGVFSKVTDTLELYRVKDIETQQPFGCRVYGVENIQLNTSDSSWPLVMLTAIPDR